MFMANFPLTSTLIREVKKNRVISYSLRLEIMAVKCSCFTAVTFWFGVSENDGTRAYIFVNIWKSLGQIAPL